MCGRYTITLTYNELLIRFYIDESFPPYHQPRYNVAPGQFVPAIIHDGRKNRLGELRWGLIPSWAKEEKVAFHMINARAETLLEKPAYRLPFERKRCLIPADGFYEWKKLGDKDKQPMRIVLKDRGLFAMAGLYDTWISPEGNKISTCTIITTQPNELMADIHDRMPAILRPEDEAMWLNREVRQTDALQALLRPYPAEEMEAYPVSKAVGNVKNEAPFLVEEEGSLL
ncbi:SOS response-associated peptidase [Paenibacillus hamazuiensis]|uniref:SOS response-associated peptidase n=1 Tax=Paenibacillus hamazuiensis TaxID=2936508 RepID=UPI00200EC3CF